MQAAQNLSHPRYWLIPAAAVLALAGVIGAGANRELFLAINRLGLAGGDVLWANVTALGDTLILLALAAPFIGRRPDIVIAVMITTLITALAVHGLKALLALPRPPAVLPAEAFHLIGPDHKSGAFPSGHSAAAFAFAGVLSLKYRHSVITAALLLAAGAVGVSRVMVGVHWPADVLAGAAVGWLCAVAGVLLAARRSARDVPGRIELIVAVPLLLAAGILLWPGATGYEDTVVLQYSVAAVGLAGGITGLARIVRRDHP